MAGVCGETGRMKTIAAFSVEVVQWSRTATVRAPTLRHLTAGKTASVTPEKREPSIAILIRVEVRHLSNSLLNKRPSQFIL